MKIGIPSETAPGERRVSLVPASVAALARAGFSVSVEAGAGERAGFPDSAYREKGAEIADSRSSLFSGCELILGVRMLGAVPDGGASDRGLLRPGLALVGLCDPLGNPRAIREAADRGVAILSFETLPRTARAQSMDVLSSMATVAGYKSVLLAAERLPRMFPLLMTAAGTLPPARLLVLGAGVAGLMAIATARRLGAVVEAYDVREAVKEQVESLGARFVELPLEAGGAEDRGGYARAMGEEFLRAQRELLGRVVAGSDVVITTAQVPGRRAPVLVDREMASRMPRGSVIVDLAAGQGGNCEPTRPGEEVTVGGVTILGPLDLPATVPGHASQMYSRNASSFLLHVAKEGRIPEEPRDEIGRETLVASGGRVVHPRVREALGESP